MRAVDGDAGGLDLSELDRQTAVSMSERSDLDSIDSNSVSSAAAKSRTALSAEHSRSRPLRHRAARCRRAVKSCFLAGCFGAQFTLEVAERRGSSRLKLRWPGRTRLRGQSSVAGQSTERPTTPTQSMDRPLGFVQRLRLRCVGEPITESCFVFRCCRRRRDVCTFTVGGPRSRVQWTSAGKRSSGSEALSRRDAHRFRAWASSPRGKPHPGRVRRR